MTAEERDAIFRDIYTNLPFHYHHQEFRNCLGMPSPYGVIFYVCLLILVGLLTWGYPTLVSFRPALFFLFLCGLLVIPCRRIAPLENECDILYLEGIARKFPNVARALKATLDAGHRLNIEDLASVRRYSARVHAKYFERCRLMLEKDLSDSINAIAK